MSTEQKMQSAIQAQKKGDYALAKEIYRKILIQYPDHTAATHYLGLCHHQIGENDEGVNLMRRSLELAPDNAQFFFDFGMMNETLGDTIEAENAYRQALSLDRHYIAPRSNLSNMLIRLGRLSEAEKLCLEGETFSPTHFLLTLGKIYFYMGDIEKAESAYRKLLEHDPTLMKPRSSLLLTLLGNPKIDKKTLFQEHLAWESNQKQAFPTLKPLGKPSGTHRDRKLRIGYLSGDFRRHSVAYFIEPILYFHDKNQFEIICYSDVMTPDDVTLRIANMATTFKSVTNLSDTELGNMIIDDQIDILVDLAGHTGIRLRMLGTRAAPVQVTYLGYAATTGLTEMDYRLTDSLVDPASEDSFHSETLIRLPDCFLTFAPPSEAPDVAPCPFRENGHITFGCFCTPNKITDQNINLWSAALDAIPNSRLILKNRAYADDRTRENMANRFGGHNITIERIEFLSYTPTLRNHLDVYNRVDIAFDTFPYNGTTTTCEALWMGVPVVTIEGDRHAARVGADLLSQMGLSSLIANSGQKFIGIIRQLASNPALLEQLRQALRPMLVNSPLCQNEKFTRNLEKIYWKMVSDDHGTDWTDWTDWMGWTDLTD